MSSMEEHFFSAGYVLIRAGTHDVHTVREELLKVEGVRIAHALIGPDDLICYLETHDPGRFRKALNSGIRRLVKEGLIDHTETMIILAEHGHGYSGEENKPAPAAAWLLCDVSVDDPGTVVAELLNIEGVVNAHPVLGRYDMIVYVEGSSTGDLMLTLDDKIRHVKGIKNTDTRLVLMRIAKEKPIREREKQTVFGLGH